MPLLMLIEAAQAGNEREVEECAKLFIDHAAKLEEVSLWFVVVRRLKTQFRIFFFFFYTAKMKMMHLHNRVMISNDSAPISVAILNQLIEVVNRIWYIFE